MNDLGKMIRGPSCESGDSHRQVTVGSSICHVPFRPLGYPGAMGTHMAHELFPW